MATKKAAKKTTKAVKKAPAKKTATKRAYTRKPKVAVEEVSAPMQEEAATEATITMTQNEFETHNQFAYDRGYNFGQAAGISKAGIQKHAQTVAQRELMAQAEFVTFDKLPPFVIVSILMELTDMGYLYANSRNLLEAYVIDDLIASRGLKLNHANKLVSIPTKEELDASTLVLQIANASNDTYLDGRLGDNKPQIVEVGGAKYSRIG